MGRTSDAREKLMEAVTELIWKGSYGSTTIDHICERAGVKKGSFYYFFESKAALAEVAIQSEWEKHRIELDGIFSPSRPPLERFHRYCESVYQDQLEMKRQFGAALGCPLCTLGAEISTLEDSLRQKVNAIMDQSRKYFENAIRDAHAEGTIVAQDAAAKAKSVDAYVEGLLTRARIQNNVDVLKDMERGILDILGARSAVRAAR